MAVIPQLLMHFFCQLIQKRNQTNIFFVLKNLSFILRDLYVRTFTSCFTIKSETTAAVQKKKRARGREKEAVL